MLDLSMQLTMKTLLFQNCWEQLNYILTNENKCSTFVRLPFLIAQLDSVTLIPVLFSIVRQEIILNSVAEEALGKER